MEIFLELLAGALISLCITAIIVGLLSLILPFTFSFKIVLVVWIVIGLLKAIFRED